jgi:hypothetical protein
MSKFIVTDFRLFESKLGWGKPVNEIGEGSAEPYQFERIKERPYRHSEGDTAIRYLFKADGSQYVVEFSFIHTAPVTNRGNMFKIMATVVATVKDYVKNIARERGTKVLEFQGSYKDEEDIGSETQRTKLYKAYLEKALKEFSGVEVEYFGNLIKIYLENLDESDVYNMRHGKAELDQEGTVEEPSEEELEEKLDLTVLRKYGKKVKQFLLNLKKELEESKEAALVLAKYAKGEKPTEEELEFFKAQVGDIIKGVGLGGVFFIPGGSLILPIVLKLSQKYNVAR